MKRLVATGIVAAVLLLGACSGGGYGSVGPGNTDSGNLPGGGTPPTPPTASTALFQVNAGVLPYPTDLYFAGSTDGTINIQPPNSVMPNQAAINGLDGFSTTAVIRENFGGALDPTSFTAASVIVVPVVTDNLTKATIGVAGAPLTLGVDYSVGPGEELNGIGATILEIKPLHPLMPSTCLPNGPANCPTGNGYLVILTNGIKDTKGNPAVPDTDYANIKKALASGGATCPSITDPALNGVCQLTGAQLQIAQALSINPANIVLTFSFTTVSTLDTLQLVAATAQPQTIKLNPTGFTTQQVNPLLQGHADVYVGVLTIPYYLSKSAPLSEYWHAPPFPRDTSSTFVTRFNPLPVPTQTLQIPVLVTVPNASSAMGATPPAGGWPVTIYQHAIHSNREDMFGIADFFADSGFVVVAIDLPLHGVTTPYDVTNPNTYFYASSANPLYAGLGLPASGSIERTFDLDLANNVTEAAGADGQIDPTGSYFINLTSLLTSRDNLREGVADLIALVRTLPQLNLGAAGSVNAGAVHFVGHSLGAVVGGTFMSVVTPGEISTATLAMTGGGIADLLRESPTFGPRINAGLEAKGVYPGTTIYEQFFRDAQNAVDSGDPINFIAYATAAHPIHLIQVVGSNTSLPDQVVPNSATQRLINASTYLPAPATAAALTQLGSATPGLQVNPAGFRAFVNFTAGDHASIVLPTASQAATEEMQLEALTFTGQPVPAAGFPGVPTPGTTILIGNPTVIQP
jgi:pimeloyl-ACP methyl ester carboxylesterase